MIFPIKNLNALFKEPIEGIISIWGDFGVGKTTFMLQTAINATKLGKKVLYIYSKPNFPFEKIRNICQKNLSEDLSDILDDITFIQPWDFEALNKIVFNLEFLILNYLKEKEDPLNIIVIDSITDLYRLELNREKKEKNFSLNYQLNQILANLSFINLSYGIEVLVVNELSRIDQDGKTIEVPSGGRVMDYWVLYDVKIARTEKLNERNLILKKHTGNEIFEFSSILTRRGFE